MLTSNYSPSPPAFSIRFEAYTPDTSALTSSETMRFNLECPFTPTSIEPRVVVTLDGPAGLIRSFGGATLPLTLGGWTTVDITVDRFGDIAIFSEGDLLHRYDYFAGPLGNFTSTNCASPSGFTFRRQGPSGAAYFVDDFQFDILGVGPLAPNGNNGLPTRIYGPRELGSSGTHLLLAQTTGLPPGQFGYYLGSMTQSLVFSPNVCGARILTNPLRRFLGTGQPGDGRRERAPQRLPRDQLDRTRRLPRPWPASRGSSKAGSGRRPRAAAASPSSRRSSPTAWSSRSKAGDRSRVRPSPRKGGRRPRGRCSSILMTAPAGRNLGAQRGVVRVEVPAAGRGATFAPEDPKPSRASADTLTRGLARPQPERHEYRRSSRRPRAPLPAPSGPGPATRSSPRCAQAWSPRVAWNISRSVAPARWRR